MIVGIRESKARLSELLARAVSGEEVLITVRGQPTVRLLPVQKKPGSAALRQWTRRLRKELGSAAPASADSANRIIDDLRGDRT